MHYYIHSSCPSQDELVDVLAQHMDALAHTDHYFVVDPSCTTMAEPNMINNVSVWFLCCIRDNIISGCIMS